MLEQSPTIEQLCDRLESLITDPASDGVSHPGPQAADLKQILHPRGLSSVRGKQDASQSV